MGELAIFEYGDKEIAYLKSRDRKLARVIESIGHIRREVNASLFESVIFCIIGQQISSRAQQTVWGRVSAALGEITPEKVGATSAETLRSLGMSQRKAEYILNFTQKVLKGEFVPDDVSKMSDQEAIAALSSLKGIGTWTAEMILIFCLQRPDILSYRDFAIIRGMRMVYQLSSVNPEFFEKCRQRLSPYCSIASLYFWEVSGGAIPELKDPASSHVYICRYKSPLGMINLASDGKNITNLWFDGQKYTDININENDIIEKNDLPVFKRTIRWLDKYFSGKNPRTDIPVCIKTTPFRKSVLDIVKSIPYGETRTYGEIANQLSQQQKGTKVSVRAVAGAIAHNPVLLLIPCHRVIGAKGHLTGYCAGLERKSWLLEME